VRWVYGARLRLRVAVNGIFLGAASACARAWAADLHGLLSARPLRFPADPLNRVTVSSLKFRVSRRDAVPSKS
jgi:hypothetical protein